MQSHQFDEIIQGLTVLEQSIAVINSRPVMMGAEPIDQIPDAAVKADAPKLKQSLTRRRDNKG